MKYLFLLILFPVFASASVCEELRGVIFIGDSYVSHIASKYNSCLDKKGQIVSENIQENLSSDSPVSNKVEIVAKLKGEIEVQNVTRIKVVISPENSEEDSKNIQRNIKNKLGIDSYILSKEELAIIKHLSLGTEKKYITWEIKNTENVFTFLDENQNYHIYINNLGTTNFRKFIIASVKGLDPTLTDSLNPLGGINAKKASNLAQTYMTTHAPKELFSIVKESTLIGVGDMQHSILSGKSKTYDQRDILSSINKLKFAKDLLEKDENLISKLLLVNGTMTSLNTSEVTVRAINDLHGSLLYRKLWK